MTGVLIWAGTALWAIYVARTFFISSAINRRRASRGLPARRVPSVARGFGVPAVLFTAAALVANVSGDESGTVEALCDLGILAAAGGLGWVIDGATGRVVARIYRRAGMTPP